jgi:zinc transport system substrate-binding protein
MKKQSIVSIMIIIALSATMALTAKGQQEQTTQAKKPMVAVSILPQSYFVERIGGDRFTQVVLVGLGQSPHSYEPTPRQMADLALSKAWILSNTDFEIGLLPKITSLYPNLRIVDGTEGVDFRSLEAHDHADEGEAHSDEEEHDEESIGMDRHTWLGREPALILARHVADTLGAVDPAATTLYENNYLALVADINQVYDSLAVSLAPLKNKTIFVYHPAFGYLFDDFDIIQEAVETGGKEPTAKSIADLIAKASSEQITAIFVQSQFPVSAAKAIAEAVGAVVVPLDPLAEDWLANIQRIGEALKASIDIRN